MSGESEAQHATEKKPISPRRKILRALIRRLVTILVTIAATYLGILLYREINPAPLPLTSFEIDTIVGEALSSTTPQVAFSAQVYQQILPSLVLVQTQIENPDSEDSGGLGSGVVINADGDILTALHVVEDAVRIRVTFADGTQATAELITANPEIDIAVLHPEHPPELIVPAILGNLNAMRIGDEAYVTGNPLGLSGSMSAGVISGFNRSLSINGTGQRIEGLIQFDAAVNPGNSGGPLLNRYGQVIGIVTGLVNPTDQNYFIGIGFAVPITVAGGAAGAPPY